MAVSVGLKFFDARRKSQMVNMLQTAAGECIIRVSRRVIRRPTLPSIRRAARLIRRPASGTGRPLASLAPRPASWLALAAPLLFTAWLAPGAGAGPVELVSADERGVTLRLSVGRYDLGPPGQEGRRQIVIPRVYLLDVPGRGS